MPHKDLPRKDLPGKNLENVNYIQANLIVTGLLVAQNKKQINYRTKTYFKVQSAIRALRRGKNLNQASQLARVYLSILHQLLIWGEPQPINLVSRN